MTETNPYAAYHAQMLADSLKITPDKSTNPRDLLPTYELSSDAQVVANRTLQVVADLVTWRTAMVPVLRSMPHRGDPGSLEATTPDNLATTYLNAASQAGLPIDRSLLPCLPHLIQNTGFLSNSWRSFAAANIPLSIDVAAARLSAVPSDRTIRLAAPSEVSPVNPESIQRWTAAVEKMFTTKTIPIKGSGYMNEELILQLLLGSAEQSGVPLTQVSTYIDEATKPFGRLQISDRPFIVDRFKNCVAAIKTVLAEAYSA